MKIYDTTTQLGHKDIKTQFSKTDNMTTFENCSLCFQEVYEKNKRLSCSRLRKLCLKYLHSSFTQEILSRPPSEYNLPLCSNCWESARQLLDISEQMKAFQKTISESIFIFSLEILHRRGKIAGVDYCTRNTDVSEGKSPEVDVSVSTNYAIGIPSSTNWNVPLTALSPESEQLPEVMTSENNYACEFNDPLQNSEFPENESIFEVTFEGIKCESNEQNRRDEDIGIEVEENASLEFSGIQKDEAISKSTSLIQCNPILKLQKLQIKSNGDKIIATASALHDITSNREKRKAATVWNKSNAGSSYICGQNDTLPINCAPSASTLTVSTDITIRKPATTLVLEEKIPIRMVDEGKKANSETGCENKLVWRKNNQFQCNVCGKRMSKWALKHHMKIHTGELPYKCEFCNRRFRQKPHMLGHLRTHTGERPFKCSLCLKSFTQSSSLKVHHRKHHTKERPHKCSTCGEGFVLKYDLTRHMRTTHSAERTLNCDQCQFTTNRERSLKVHKISVHPDLKDFNWFKCRECEMRFKSPDLVKGHYECVHFALDFSDECIIKCK